MADQRFSFVSDKEVAETRGKRVPVSTQRHTLWSRNVSLPTCISNNELNMDDDKDDDLLLVKACEDYEKSVSVSVVLKM